MAAVGGAVVERPEAERGRAYEDALLSLAGLSAADEVRGGILGAARATVESGWRQAKWSVANRASNVSRGDRGGLWFADSAVKALERGGGWRRASSTKAEKDVWRACWRSGLGAGRGLLAGPGSERLWDGGRGVLRRASASEGEGIAATET